MAFQASAPPLPDYQPLSGSEMSKPSSSQAGEQSHQSSLHSFITPAPPDPLRGFPADPHPHHHHHHHQPGYGFGYGAHHPHFPEQANPQLAPYPPLPNTVVFGFPKISMKAQPLVSLHAPFGIFYSNSLCVGGSTHMVTAASFGPGMVLPGTLAATAWCIFAAGIVHSAKNIGKFKSAGSKTKLLGWGGMLLWLHLLSK